MKKIWHISDTHSYHKLLTIPSDIDIVIHSGDFSNHRDVFKNEPEARDFLYWYAGLNIKHKVLIAGNHDALAYKWNTKFKETCSYLNITYLENETTVIDGIKIWGSPHTPTFGDWYFQKARHSLNKVWENIPDNTDIIVVHGPCKGILDLSHKRDNSIERCGCSALTKRVLKIEPKLFLSGHIHNNKDIINAGTLKLSKYNTIFSNGSVVTDGKFGTLSSNGNILNI